MEQNEIISICPADPSDFFTIYQWLFYSEIDPFRKEVLESCHDKIPSTDDFKNDFPSFFFDGTAPEKGRSYMIRNNQQDLIGHICYTAFHLLPGMAELDIWLSAKKYIGHGYGRKAIDLLAADLFLQGYHTLIMRPSINNKSAIRAYKKAGFQEVTPDYKKYYSPDYIDIYAEGDFGAGKDLFLCRFV